MIQKINTSFGKAKIYRKGSGPKILIVPGYAESIVHNRELVDRLASKGYDAFTFSQPRRNSFVNPINRQQAIVLDVIDVLVPKDQNVFIVAHSLGAAAALGAAKIHPEKLQGLLLMQPSGIGEKQTFLQLLRRVSKKTARNHENVTRVDNSVVYTVALRHVLRAHTASARHIIRNPLLALREANAAVQHMIAEDIIQVQKLDVPVDILLVHNDELFTMGSMLEYDHAITLPGVHSSLAHREARHDTFWIHPEQTASIIDTFIRHRT